MKQTRAVVLCATLAAMSLAIAVVVLSELSADDASVADPRRNDEAASRRRATDAGPRASSSTPRDVDDDVRALVEANERLRAELAASRRRIDGLAADLAEVRRVASDAASLASATPRVRERSLAGAWEQSVDGGGAWPLELADDGTIRNGAGDQVGTWSRSGASLVLRWPNPGAPGGGEWIDSCVVAADGASYVGTNQRGSVIRGARAVNR